MAGPPGDPDHQRPVALRDKIRRLELLTAAEPRQGKRVGDRIKVGPQRRKAEHELARQAEIAYRRLVTDWTAQGRWSESQKGLDCHP